MKLLPFKNVAITGGFWQKRQTVNRENTLPIEYRQCKDTGRIDAWSQSMSRYALLHSCRSGGRTCPRHLLTKRKTFAHSTCNMSLSKTRGMVTK